MKIGILHISDLHIDEKSCGSIDSMLKKLVEDIKKYNKMPISILNLFVLQEI